ncbi:uncharacterized protein KQ657_001433 [Scheffersomyces spartinae]|uniref:glucan 1,3-beta-glucosidase n=1 Tax=Scheffersomyces spartinae TaxID=45513 RepID=A0A9P7V781_9ASCO|nr:uncharacterized protein KQ657_001433 [Scheffersomyces spartinae]KAG7192653.1 hypothetical protein KQ657_001433 [Scheffersomyces spartinae]
MCINNNVNSSALKHNSESIRGVSLGGWLVLEPWITPSLFELALNITKSVLVDEYTLCLQLGPEAQPLLSSHWASFITKSDIASISSMGFNMIRVPIGYWAIQKQAGDPYVAGQLKYLDKAIEWCKEYGLKVQIDLHGMPGSQNGFDNSGQRTSPPLWLQNDDSFQISVNVLRFVFAKYSLQPFRETIHSIEVVNEPFGPILGRSKIEEFYQLASEMSQTYDIPIFVHDAFLGIDAWAGFQDTTPTQVTVDHHFYSIFSQAQIEWDRELHFQNVIKLGNMLAQSENSKVVGEFSGALTDCAPYLNGVGLGHRFDGTLQQTIPIGTCSNYKDIAKWASEDIVNTLKFIYLQIQVYERSCGGWIFWTYKTEGAWEWDYTKLVAIGLLPSTINQIINDNQVLKDLYHP